MRNSIHCVVNYANSAVAQARTNLTEIMALCNPNIFSTEPNVDAAIEHLKILQKLRSTLKRTSYVMMSTDDDVAAALRMLHSQLSSASLFFGQCADSLKISQLAATSTSLANLCNGQTTAQPGFYAPGIFVHSNSTRLHVCTGTMSNGNEGVDTEDLPIGRTVRVAVRVAGGQMSVSIDGQEVAKRIRYAMTQETPLQNDLDELQALMG